MMEQKKTTCHFEYKEPPYKWRPWMGGRTFTMKRIEYRIVQGDIIVKDHQMIWAILFEEVKTGKKYKMAEEEFFSKVDPITGKAK